MLPKIPKIDFKCFQDFVLDYIKLLFQSPDGVAQIYCQVFQRVWHDTPLCFNITSTLNYNPTYKTTIYRFLEVTFLLLYGSVLIPFIFIRPALSSCLGWLHITLYLVAIVASSGCALIDYRLNCYSRELFLSFNALVDLRKRFQRGENINLFCFQKH